MFSYRDRTAIKARIEAKRVRLEKSQKKTTTGEDNKRLVVDYEEVHGGNTILPKAVSVKIDGTAKVPEPAPAPASDSHNVAVQAMIHVESGKSNGITPNPTPDGVTSVHPNEKGTQRERSKL